MTPFKTILAGVIALLALAAATPVADVEIRGDGEPVPYEERDLEERQGTWIILKLWEHAGWSGASFAFAAVPATCYSMPNGWNDRVSSIEICRSPGPRRCFCRYFEHGGCNYNNGQWESSDSDVADFSAPPYYFNDKMSSFVCWLIG